MFFPNRRTALGYLALLLPPLVITLLAFATLARLDEADMVVGVPLDAALDPTPDPLAEALALFQGGVAQQEAGNYAAAEAAYRSALTVDPALAPVYNALGSLYVAWQRPSEAIPMYRQATRLKPEAAEFWRNLGVVQANQGQTEAGLAALETAVALAPIDPHLHYELGQLYASVQRPEAARQTFSRVLKLTTDPALAAQAATQLRLLPQAPAHIPHSLLAELVNIGQTGVNQQRSNVRDTTDGPSGHRGRYVPGDLSGSAD